MRGKEVDRVSKEFIVMQSDVKQVKSYNKVMELKKSKVALRD